MDGFKAFINANAMALAIGLTLLAVVLAFLRMGQPAVVAGLLGGMLFMWIARPHHPEEDAAEE